MKKHTKWIIFYAGIIVILAVFTGISFENKHMNEDIAFNYSGRWEPAADPEIYYEIELTDLRPEDMDILMRMDLGYPKIENIIHSYENTIRRYAGRYGFDWRLILAVMNQESRFRIQAVSHRGAFGLMQIMPTTGEEVATALGIEGVTIPEDNIAGGVYYLWRMYNLFSPDNEFVHAHGDYDFDRLRLALAAYNGGPSRVRDAQYIAHYLGLDPYRWDTIRDLLPMLSRRYSSLHYYIWTDGRPPGGYFEGFKETLNYVDRTIEYYSYYRQMFE